MHHSDSGWSYPMRIGAALLAVSSIALPSARGQVVNSNFDDGCAGNSNWGCAQNWTPDQVPDNGSPVGTTYNVTLDGFAGNADDPVLDDFQPLVDILTLSMLQDAVLRVQSTDLNVGAMVMDDHTTYRGLGASPTTELNVDTLTLNEGDPSAGPFMRLTGGMVVTSQGEFLMDGSNYSGGPGSCTPPDLAVLGLSGINVSGDFTIINAAKIDYLSGVNMCLAGSWNNFSRFPDLANITNHQITLAAMCPLGPAPGAPHAGPEPRSVGGTTAQYEVAGVDVGPVLAFADNFGVAEVEVDDNYTVIFQDAFDNDGNAQKQCTEALYTNTLTLGADANVIIDNCRIYYIQLIDEGAAIQTQGCGQLVQLSVQVPAGGPGALAGLLLLLGTAGVVLLRRRAGECPVG